MNNLPANKTNTALTPAAQKFLAFAQQQGGVESLAEGIGSSYGVISYKGKTWSLRYKGEKYFMVRPDDRSPAGYLDVVILRQAKQRSKSYYEGYDQDASDGKRPLCASLDGITPDSDVPQRQAEACILCPKNAWKTNDKGRKVKDCTDYKRLAVLLVPGPNLVTNPSMSEPLLEPVFLRVPAASLQPLANFGEDISRQGYPYFSVITRITFEPDQAHPVFHFRALQALGDNEAGFILEAVQNPLGMRITGEEQVASGGLKQVPSLPPAPAQSFSGFTTLQAPAPMPTGFTVPVTSTAPVQQVTAPKQEVIESNEDIDARIAKVLQAPV